MTGISMVVGLVVMMVLLWVAVEAAGLLGTLAIYAVLIIMEAYGFIHDTSITLRDKLVQFIRSLNKGK